MVVEDWFALFEIVIKSVRKGFNEIFYNLEKTVV